MTEEVFKDIPGYEGYQISNMGNVKSLNYNRTGKEKVLSPEKNNKGYLQVNLYKNGERKSFRIHRLVYETFVGEIPEGIQVNHIDEDKENCRLENLNLMTPKANANWGTGIARSAAARSKPVEAFNDNGNVVLFFPSTMEAGRNGFHQGHVAACCRGELKSHKGLRWRYV